MYIKTIMNQPSLIINIRIRIYRNKNKNKKKNSNLIANKKYLNKKKFKLLDLFII